MVPNRPRPLPPTTAPPIPPPDPERPRFRRATPADAVALALDTFNAGQRLDMNTLAADLSVSRATLYRWVGSREHLLTQVLDQLTTDFVEQARRHARGDGDERLFAFARQLMHTTVSYQPVRLFVAREPELALRLLLGRNGVVHRATAQGVTQVLAETRPPEEIKALAGFIETTVQIGTALQWATFAIGDEPQIERVIDVARILLQSGKATTLTPSRPTRTRRHPPTPETTTDHNEDRLTHPATTTRAGT